MNKITSLIAVGLTALSASSASSARPHSQSAEVCAPATRSAAVCKGYEASLKVLVNHYRWTRSTNRAKARSSRADFEWLWTGQARRFMQARVNSWRAGTYNVASADISMRKVMFGSKPGMARITSLESWQILSTTGGYVPLIEIRVTHTITMKKILRRWVVTNYK